MLLVAHASAGFPFFVFSRTCVQQHVPVLDSVLDYASPICNPWPIWAFGQMCCAIGLAYHLSTTACDYYLFSIFLKTGRDWNSLPQEVVQLSTPGAFRSALQP